MDGGARVTHGGRAASLTVVHYVNQFFAGLGGEEAAGNGPVRLEGPQGPGRALAAAGLDVDVTIACGDDHFGEHEHEALATLLGWVDRLEPDVLVCGPSFGSGRYGYACGVLAREVGRRGVPVVAAMTPDSPGVLAAEGAAYIVPTGSNVAGMREALPDDRLARRPAGRGEPVGAPDDEGYLPRGLRVNALADRSGAERAVDLLLAKLAGDVRTEVVPSVDSGASGAGRRRHHVGADRARHRGRLRAHRAIRTGCRPATPTSGCATRSPTDGSLSADAYESVHAGFDTSVANEDPNRLVPLDADARARARGHDRRLHEVVLHDERRRHAGRGRSPPRSGDRRRAAERRRSER